MVIPIRGFARPGVMTLHGQSYLSGKMVFMKSATRVTSKGQVLGDGAVRLTPLEAGNPIDILYGCLRDLPGDPLADLEAEHQAEIEADATLR